MMILINWWESISVILLAVFIWKYLDSRHFEVNWGTSEDSLKYLGALKAIHTLNKLKAHTKTYRPNIMLLVGDPREREGLVRLGNVFSKGRGLVTFGNVVLIPESLSEKEQFRELYNSSNGKDERYDFFKSLGIKGTFEEITSYSFREGVRALLQLGGLS
jgi:solute carrier family 12 sodium/potassium/chloride transporter 2